MQLASVLGNGYLSENILGGEGVSVENPTYPNVCGDGVHASTNLTDMP